ncbi:carboxypeptidase-like regulatory domain-containing protein [bacterium]|nr:carboxypeptidase-like regulatory domain-containing protein [bacterium]MCI0602765.1 carboxypeptidase-like regulatory domain-containing protein [bacterium]
MKKLDFVRIVAILCIGLMLPLGTGTTWAQPQQENKNKKEVDIEGRVYDYDKDKPLHGVTVRIVNTETGEAREDETDKNGCYEFDDVADGTYSFSVFYKGKDETMMEKVKGEFLLANKITVQASTEKDILIKTCVSLQERNTLFLMDDCDLCRKVPPYIWVVPAVVVAGGIIGRDEDEEVSPSRP